MKSFPTRNQPIAIVPLKLESCWERFRKSWGMSLLWQKGLLHNSPAQQPLVSNLLAAIETEDDPSGWEIQQTAIFLAMARMGSQSDSGLLGAELICRFQPITKSFPAQLQALKLGSNTKDNCSSLNDNGPNWLSTTSDTWAPLRQTLSSCSENDFQFCLKQAQTAFATGSLLEKNFLAFLFPDQDWWREAAALTLDTARPEAPLPACGEALLASVKDFEIARRLVQNRSYPPPATYAWPVAQQFGWQSAAVLVAAASQQKDWATPLFDIDHPEVAAALAGALAQNNLRAGITSYFKRHPHLAATALQPVAKGKSKAAPLAQALLDSLSPAKPSATPDGPNVTSDPSLAEIPAWLESPPWKQKRVKSKPAILENLRLESPEALHLPTPLPPAGFSGSPEVVADRWSSFTQRLRAGLALDPCQLDGLSDEHLATVFERANPAQWPTDTDYMPLLVRLGLNCLPALEMLAYQDIGECLRLLQHIESPKAAGIAAAGLAGAAYPRLLAKRWLERYPQAAAAGLIPRAFGPVGDERSEAESALGLLPAAVVRTVASGTPAQPLVEDFLNRDPLEAYPNKIPKLPDFCANLPGLQTQQGQAVSPKVTETLLEMLAFSTSGEPYVGIQLAKVHLSADSLEELSWQLLLRWLLAGAPAKEKWAAFSLIHYGGEKSARRLAQLLPRESALQKAELGLNILYQIPTAVAFFQLSLLAKSMRPMKGLQAQAEIYLQKYAKLHNWTERQLSDHCTPDFGFDQTRTMQVELDGEIHIATLADQLDLRLENQQDPAAKLQKEAQAWLKNSKADLKAMIAVQSRNLEEAMIASLRWSVSEAKVLFVDHPVTSLLCRDLVWIHTSDQNEARLFLLAEGIPSQGMIGIVHPLEIDESQRQHWASLQLSPPFAEMRRPFERTPQLDEICKRWNEHDIFEAQIGALLAKGWRAEPSPQSDTRDWLVRRWSNQCETRIQLLPGLNYGEERNDMEQEMDGILLVRSDGSVLNWADFPVLMSETYLELKSFLSAV